MPYFYNLLYFIFTTSFTLFLFMPTLQFYLYTFHFHFFAFLSDIIDILRHFYWPSAKCLSSVPFLSTFCLICTHFLFSWFSVRYYRHLVSLLPTQYFFSILWPIYIYHQKSRFILRQQIFIKMWYKRFSKFWIKDGHRKKEISDLHTTVTLFHLAF